MLRVDEEYFKGKILEHSNDKLSNMSPRSRASYEMMMNNFNSYAGKEEKGNVSKLTIEDMLKNLTNQFNMDLKSFELDKWKKIQNFCWNSRKQILPNGGQNDSVVNIDEMIDTSLRIYKSSDRELYSVAKQIIEKDNTLLFYNDLKLTHYYKCGYLDEDIIACEKDGRNSYINFIHELQHVIDDTLFPKLPLLFSETLSIFYETLMADHLNSKTNCPELYAYRINNHVLVMHKMYDYINALSRFVNAGCDINAQNVAYVLNVYNENELRKYYDNTYGKHFYEAISYLISFCRSLQIRYIYYNNKKDGMNELKKIGRGESRAFNYDDMADAFNEHLGKVKTLQKFNS